MSAAGASGILGGVRIDMQRYAELWPEALRVFLTGGLFGVLVALVCLAGDVAGAWLTSDRLC
jgi:hypothetical protein